VLKLLLDEHISPDVAMGLRRLVRGLPVRWMVEWEGGNFLGRDDALWMPEAAAQNLTLVTYDRRTIPPLLKTWAEEGRQHGGVIFVDEKTIAQSNIGALVRALRNLVKESQTWDWRDRVCFLR